ncbi:MAG: hypothetical protein MUF72_02360 [Elainella sp. Prado103]|nr:hypothetical protein [Elainella sp. Prado103]
MQVETEHTQLTFHYLNGQSESFIVPDALEDDNRHDMRIEVRHILQKDWWILNLAEQTVMINVANVTKIEVKPSLTQLQGEGIFANAERVSALNRVR